MFEINCIQVVKLEYQIQITVCKFSRTLVTICNFTLNCAKKDKKLGGFL